MLQTIFSFLTGGVLGRVFDTIDKKIENETNRDKIKGDIVVEYYRTRADYMRSGGFWLMCMFALPLAFWFSAVLVYSVLWCHGCAYPQTWTIAALPPPLDQWAGGMIVSIFSVVGLRGFKK